MKISGPHCSETPRPVHFLAVDLNAGNLASTLTPYILIPVNAVKGENNLGRLEGILSKGKKILLDSGIFNLLMEHAKRHKLDFNQALGLQPGDVDGFDKLWARYLEIITRLGDQLWGYIELDVGGQDTKTRMREKLEALGFHPIPVYHPINDTREYFDTLASQYNCICIGNLSQSDNPSRLRIIATIWERKQAYPNLWVHLLGFTPNEWANAYPCESSDSSSWLTAARFPQGTGERAEGHTLGPIPRGFQYNLKADREAEDGAIKGKRLASYMAILQERNLRIKLQSGKTLWEKLSSK